MSEAKQKILFSIPDFYNLYNLNSIILSYMKAEPDKFYDDVVVDSIYGSFPGCIWNSGRAACGWASIENMVQTVASINNAGISVRYTFTNSEIKGRHLFDYYCNTILQNTGKIVEGVQNGVNINQPILAEYIQKNYPEFYLIWSTTKGVDSVEETNELSKDRLTVLYYGLNNTTALKELEHPENIEVLVSEACVERCPKRMEHYKSIGKLQLLEPSEPFRCPYNCEQYFYYETPVKRDHYVTIDDIRDIYLPLGINKFKISGRQDNPVNIIENYVNYFAKPEYRDLVRNKVLISFYSGIPLQQNQQQQ